MKKILIAEDDINLIKLYELKFTNAGYQVETAENGIECVNKALNGQPNLILLDLMMPKQNGFDTLRILKENKKSQGIPVIILSSLSQQDDVTQVMEMGAIDYIVKSRISMSDLVAKVDKHLA